MNIKFLKFIVIFMAVLIVIGIIILFIGIYNKINYIGSPRTSKENYSFKINKPQGMNIISHVIKDNNLIISYEDNENIKIIIYDYFKEKIIKEIDLLK